MWYLYKYNIWALKGIKEKLSKSVMHVQNFCLDPFSVILYSSSFLVIICVPGSVLGAGYSTGKVSAFEI